MTSAELIARLREIDPDGTLTVVFADEVGNYPRDTISRERMIHVDGELWYDMPDDEDDANDNPDAVEVILI